MKSIAIVPVASLRGEAAAVTAATAASQAHESGTVARWSVEAILALYGLPFMDLMFRAQEVHRQHFNSNEVQLSTLLSIKTGGCAEDCGYCPQSAHFETGVEASKLMPLEEVVAAAHAAKAQGATRFCMGALARPLPARVIARLLDMEGVEQQDFLAWSEDLAAFIGAPDPDSWLKRRAQSSLLKMCAAFEELLARRRAQAADLPDSAGDDLIAHLLHAEASGKVESEAEMLAQCAMLLFAGHETTRNLLGNGLQALLSHPEQ